MAGFLPSSQWANVVHTFTAPNLSRPPSITYTVNNGPNDYTPDVLALTLHTAFGDHFAERLDNEWALSITEVYMGPTPSVNGAQELTNVPGTRAGAAPPPNSSLLVTKTTPFIGRTAQGRIYFPAGFLAEELINESGIYQQAAVDNFQGVCTAWLSELTSEAPMYLAHSGTVADPPAQPTPYVVNSLDVQALTATQRRRLRS